jgi:hypothetical protein
MRIRYKEIIEAREEKTRALQETTIQGPNKGV